MADYDKAPPMPVSDYRRFQNVIPGVGGLYRSVRAIMDATLPDNARILIAGAGAGREVETLGASSKEFRLTGFDPSADMLALASTFAEAPNLKDRVKLINGIVDDVESDPPFDAATSILVMHFLPDDGAKERYLNAIRRRLKSGAPYVHVDVSFDDRAMFDRLAPAVREHALIVALPEAVADGPAAHIGRMAFGEGVSSIVSEARTRALMDAAGFENVTPFFRGFWYAGWWAEAV
jgi:tRNA (cmo5U34)-methyltransferase